VPLHDIDLHYLHVPGVGPNPYPLLLLHGWPGSVFEFLDIIPRLTDPARFGCDPRDASTVIAPSLPGYGLSFKPGQKRFVLQDIADCLHDLMTKTLGFQKFAAQGGDWGAGIASLIGQKYPSSVCGTHLNLLFAPRDKISGNSESEARYGEQLAHWLKEETGYQQIQGTKPQTMAFGLTDSPAGLAAWIAEKFRSWSAQAVSFIGTNAKCRDVRNTSAIGGKAEVTRVDDADVMHLLKVMLKASGKKGVPQGGVISPLLSMRWTRCWSGRGRSREMASSHRGSGSIFEASNSISTPPRPRPRSPPLAASFISSQALGCRLLAQTRSEDGL
jgi:pimeloyl-ACP methyl ester carboxylesterase